MRAASWRFLVPALLALPALPAAAPVGASSGAAADTFAPPLFGSAAVVRARAGSATPPVSSTTAWNDFRKAHPGPWRAEWDARSGTPRQIWGASLPLVPEDASAPEVEAAIRRLLAGELARLARVADERLRTAVCRKRGDTWFVRFDRLAADGTVVADAYVEGRVTRGRLVLLRLETHPDAESAAPRQRLDVSRAISLAEDALRPYRILDRSDAVAVLAPIESGTGWTYRPAWEVVTRAPSGESWRTRVDAVSGDVLARHSLTPSISGRVTGMVEPRTVGEPLVESAMPHVFVATTGTSTAVASTDGTWTLAEPAPLSIETRLRGPFLDVHHDVATEGVAQFVALDGAADFAWTTAEATQSEIAAYRHASTAREWALGLVPALAWLQETLTVRVGVPNECNAQWDGSIVLYGEGANCNDTARIADVVYHEYGHGLHENLRVSGILDPTVGEGAGDYVSATITGSPRIGLGLQKGIGDGAFRDVGEDRVYPGDLEDQIHTDGLIFAGAMWDTRNALVAQHGETVGRRISDALFLEILVAGPALDQVFVEALLADDDDANLANGTPNRCVIEAELGRHGLTGVSGLFSLSHSEIAAPSRGKPIPVTASRPVDAALCGTNETAEATLHWSIGEDDFAAPMTLAGDTFTGAIAPVSGHVRYWFEATLASGGTAVTPARAPSNTFGFHSGALEVVWADDFEAAATWTSGGDGDDWQIGAPQGLGGDPAAAHSGANVLGNRLDGDGLYVAGADNWIESPAIDCRRCKGALLRFRRHSRVQQAIADRATVGIGTIPVWQNEQGVTFDEPSVDDPFWSYQEYDISELADGGANIRIRFSLESDTYLELGGWTIDDVAIVMPVDDGDGSGCGCSLVTGSERRGPPVTSAIVLLLAIGWLGCRRRA